MVVIVWKYREDSSGTILDISNATFNFWDMLTSSSSVDSDSIHLVLDLVKFLVH